MMGQLGYARWGNENGSQQTGQHTWQTIHSIRVEVVRVVGRDQLKSLPGFGVNLSCEVYAAQLSPSAPHRPAAEPSARARDRSLLSPARPRLTQQNSTHHYTFGPATRHPPPATRFRHRSTSSLLQPGWLNSLVVRVRYRSSGRWVYSQLRCQHASTRKGVPVFEQADWE